MKEELCRICGCVLDEYEKCISEEKELDIKFVNFLKDCQLVEEIDMLDVLEKIFFDKDYDIEIQIKKLLKNVGIIYKWLTSEHENCKKTMKYFEGEFSKSIELQSILVGDKLETIHRKNLDHYNERGTSFLKEIQNQTKKSKSN